MSFTMKSEHNSFTGIGVKLAMNSFYVENLIEKIRIGVQWAKKEGKYKGGKKGHTWKQKKP